MIFTAVIHILIAFVKLILAPLPSLPQMSQSIIDAGQWCADTVGGIIGFLNILYSSTLLSAIMVLLIAILGFDQIYWVVMWIAKKIPMINLK